MNTEQDGPSLDFRLEGPRTIRMHPRVGERGRDTAGRMSRRFTKARGQRPRSDDRSNAGQHECNGGKEQSAQLADDSCRTRLFDLRTRRGAKLLRERALFVMVACDDRDLVAPNAFRVQPTRGRRHGRRAIEQGEDEGMVHVDGINADCRLVNYSSAVSIYDAAIVGAGPAGTIAARDLARAGARVAMIDGSHPREKSCGGGVTARALELLGREAPCPDGCAIRSATFETDGNRAHVTISSADALMVFPRASFDAALLRQAVAAGADLVAARARAIDRSDGSWTIDSTSGPLRARWLLGADGPSGIVRKRVFRPFDRDQLSIAAGAFVDGVVSSEVVVRFVDDPRGYLWSFPRPDHLAVGTCAQATETSTAALHHVTDRWLRTYGPAADRPRRRYAWPIPSLSAQALDREKPGGANWMLLGDAAGLVDPITREGIFFAMRSGTLAASALRGHDPARVYAASIRDEVHAELRRATELKAAFFRPRFTRLLIEALNQSAAIRAVMIDLIAGRQAYAGLKRRLLGTLEFGLMMKLVRSQRHRLVEADQA